MRWRVVVVVGVLLSTAGAVLAQPALRDEFAAGLAALVQRDFGAAERWFRQVVSGDPSSHEGHNNLAVAYAEQGREEDAVAELRVALQLRPDYERARHNLAAVYVRMAARELLVSAEQADAPRQQMLALTARSLLSVGPQLAVGDLLARADRLAIPRTQPVAVATASPTETPLPAAALHQLPVVIEPIGALLVIGNVHSQSVALYRRNVNRFDAIGQWPAALAGNLPIGGLSLLRTRASRNARFTEIGAPNRRWALASAAAAGERDAPVRMAPEDFSKAASGLRPNHDLAFLADTDVVPVVDARLRERLRGRVEDWRVAWQQQDLVGYAGYYADNYVDAQGRSRDEWLARKRAIFDRGGPVTVEVHRLVIVAAGDIAATRFQQQYQSALEQSRGGKQLLWRRLGNEWRIVTEEADPNPTPYAPDE